MAAAQKPSPTTTLVPPWNAPGDATLRAHRKVQAPFVLTEMNTSRKFPVLWFWSRRGKSWIIEQELDPNLSGPSILATRKDP
jgi:hypothetical protein